MKYSLSPREILRAKSEGFPEGKGYILQYIPTHVSHVTCHVSCVTCKTNNIIEKLVELVSRGSVINGPYPVLFFNETDRH